MANKNTHIIKERLYKQYDESRNKLLRFYVFAIVIASAAAICYFLNWVYVYNSDYGIEVKASGFSFIAAALSGKYSSADKIYGDLAMPFYYYAKNSSGTLGTVTLVSFIVNIASVIVLVVVRLTKLQELSALSIFLGVVSSVLLSAAFIIALGMKNDRILSGYCGGNPKCTIGSSAVLPALLAICGTAVQWFAAQKLKRLNKEYNAEIAKL